MRMTRVTRGVCIDLGCNSIHQIEEGWFIPGNAVSSDCEQEYLDDIQSFKDKWFPDVPEGDVMNNPICET